MVPAAPAGRRVAALAIGFFLRFGQKSQHRRVEFLRVLDLHRVITTWQNGQAGTGNRCRDLLAEQDRHAAEDVAQAVFLVMARKAAQKARDKFDVAVCEPNFHDRIRKVLKTPRP